jgi:hypothetical protein
VPQKQVLSQRQTLQTTQDNKLQHLNWTTIGADSTDTQTATNAANIEFPASGGTNNTITHVIIADASSSGNILFVGALDASKVIASGDIFRINAGNLTIELK